MTETNADKNRLDEKVALVTGSAVRVGAAVIRSLHEAGATTLIHYRRSKKEALALERSLLETRPDSAGTVQCDFSDINRLDEMVHTIVDRFGRLDILVNNASSFYPTPVGEITEIAWDDLFASNLKAPLFLSQSAAPHLKETSGLIINIIDIYARKHLPNHTVYCAAKAGLAMLTKSLARELGPEIRVNGIAPGPILWPEQIQFEESKQQIIDSTALKRAGSPDDIAGCVLYLACANFVTGQIIAVDGGRSIGW